MKKIALCSLIMCGLTGIAFGDSFCGVECNSDRNEKFMVCPGNIVYIKKCNGTLWESITNINNCDGSVEALAQPGYINVGDWNIYTGIVVWVKRGATKTGNGYLFDNSNKENFCSACRQGFKFDEEQSKCVNVKEASVRPACDPNHPETCKQNPKTPQLSKPCGGGKKVNDYCEAGNHATLGRCRNLEATKGGVEQFTCAATECEDGYLLWLDKKGISQGICHSVEYANDFCRTGKCPEPCTGECVPWIVDTPSTLKINGRTLTPKKNGAYRECHCVAKDGGNGGGGTVPPNDDELSECYLRLSFDVPCVGVPTYKAYTKISLTKAQVATIEGLTCNGSTDVTNTVLGNASIDVNALINNVNSIRSKLEALLCKGGTIILPSGSDGGDIAAAEE